MLKFIHLFIHYTYLLTDHQMYKIKTIKSMYFFFFFEPYFLNEKLPRHKQEGEKNTYASLGLSLSEIILLSDSLIRRLDRLNFSQEVYCESVRPPFKPKQFVSSKTGNFSIVLFWRLDDSFWF